MSKLANTFLKAPSANANTFLSLQNLFNSSLSECQQFSNFANTFFKVPSGYVNTFLSSPTIF
jgi:hypothetical protein